MTAKGALTFQPRLPAGPLGALIRCSDLALAAWFRTGGHHSRPSFRSIQLNRSIPSDLRADLDRLFGGLGHLAAAHKTPVTVLLVPNYEQVTRGAPCGFQDDLTPILRGHGIDVCDVRETFRGYPDKPALFIPDKHFTALGNRLLLAELLRHLRGLGVRFEEKPS